MSPGDEEELQGTGAASLGRGDRLVRRAAAYYGGLGVILFLVDVMSGRLRSLQVWWGPDPSWYGLFMAPLSVVGLVLSSMAVRSGPSTRRRRAGGIALVVLFSAATIVSGMLAYDYLVGRS